MATIGELMKNIKESFYAILFGVLFMSVIVLALGIFMYFFLAWIDWLTNNDPLGIISNL